MTGGGAYDGDMPTFPRTTQGEIPPVGDPAYDALLARTLAPDDAPTGLRPVAEGFAALYETPVNVTPAAESNALASFRGAIGRPAEPARPPRRRRPVLASLLSAKLAAAAAAAAVALGGAAAAAYTGRLPAPAQKFAHDTIGAPKTPAHSPHTQRPPSRPCCPWTPPTACAPPTRITKPTAGPRKRPRRSASWPRPQAAPPTSVRTVPRCPTPGTPLARHPPTPKASPPRCPRTHSTPTRRQALHAALARTAHPPGRQALHAALARTAHPPGRQAHQRPLT